MPFWSEKLPSLFNNDVTSVGQDKAEESSWQSAASPNKIDLHQLWQTKSTNWRLRTDPNGRYTEIPGRAHARDSLLESLPGEILLRIEGYLPPSSSLALKQTCRRLRYHDGELGLLLSYKSVRTDPSEWFDFCCLQEKRTATASWSQTFRERCAQSPGPRRLWTCAACKELHPVNWFAPAALDQPPSERRCRGIQICAHVYITLTQCLRFLASSQVDKEPSVQHPESSPAKFFLGSPFPATQTTRSTPLNQPLSSLLDEPSATSPQSPPPMTPAAVPCAVCCQEIGRLGVDQRLSGGIHFQYAPSFPGSDSPTLRIRWSLFIPVVAVSVCNMRRFTEGAELEHERVHPPKLFTEELDLPMCPHLRIRDVLPKMVFDLTQHDGLKLGRSQVTHACCDCSKSTQAMASFAGNGVLVGVFRIIKVPITPTSAQWLRQVGE